MTEGDSAGVLARRPDVPRGHVAHARKPVPGMPVVIYMIIVGVPFLIPLTHFDGGLAEHRIREYNNKYTTALEGPRLTTNKHFDLRPGSDAEVFSPEWLHPSDAAAMLLAHPKGERSSPISCVTSILVFAFDPLIAASVVYMKFSSWTIFPSTARTSY